MTGRPAHQGVAAKISPRSKSDRVPVLEFHDFVPKRLPNTMWLDCSLPEFRQILKTIDADKLRPITLDRLYAHLNEGAKLPRGAIVLTFDDNYQGFYDYAYPLLKAKRFPFALFVHTDYVGSRVGQPKMSWNTLKLLVKEGLATVGSHTLSHRDLPTLSDAAQRKEITQSKLVLERHLGITVDYFAYPHGRKNALSELLLQQAGYKMAFTGINRPAEESPNIWTVNRYAQTVYRRALRDCGYGR